MIWKNDNERIDDIEEDRMVDREREGGRGEKRKKKRKNSKNFDERESSYSNERKTTDRPTIKQSLVVV